MSAYRYSKPRFRQALAIAAALTAAISGLVWMIAAALGANANRWALVAALIFFAFVSASMLVRYLSDTPVLLVQPTGLHDRRHSADTIAWERIREIVLRQRETEVELDIFLWKQQRLATANASPDFTVELSPLEADPRVVIEAIARHKPVRMEAMA